MNPVKNVLLKLLPVGNPKEEKKVLEIEKDKPVFLDKVAKECSVKAGRCELPIPKAYAEKQKEAKRLADFQRKEKPSSTLSNSA